MVRKADDSGQAAPLYIMMVALLLFLALAFFAVGQAGATRNGAQSAADAAALAAAQESRDAFRTELLGSLLEPGYLAEIFNGAPVGDYDGCAAAAYFAVQNGGSLGPGGCSSVGGGVWGFRVEAQAPMGDSILQGTNAFALAHATAIVEPRCDFEAADEEPEPPAGEGGPDGDKPSSPGQLHCDGADLTIDPEHLDLLPDMADLFSVRLAED